MRRLLVALVAVLLIASPVAADHTGLGWPREVPAVVYTNATGFVADGLAVAVAQWNASPYVEWTIGVAPKGSVALNGVTYPCAKRTGKIVACVAGDGGATWLDYGPNGIRSAFVMLGIAFPLNGICEELGHALGLFHSSDPDSCMTPGGSDHPSAHDFAALATMYGP